MGDSGCPRYEDIEKLVFSSYDGDLEWIHFLSHVKQCVRCRYIWEQLSGHGSDMEMPEIQADSTERMITAMSRKGAIVLLPFRKQREKIEETSVTTLMAADTEEVEDREVKEVATLASKVEGVLLRVLKDIKRRVVHLYLSFDDCRPRPVLLYLQGLDEPVDVGVEGVVLIPLERLGDLIPSLAVIVPV